MKPRPAALGTFRHVVALYGRTLGHHDGRLAMLLASPAPMVLAQARGILEESSRYNLANVRRNMNVPTLTLGFMRPTDQWRFKFRRQKDETIDGRPARVLGFKDHARPTLIGSSRRGEIPAEGRIWIDAATGAVLRIELRFDSGSERRNYIRTDFGHVPDVDVLVPLRMWEWYEGADQVGRIGGDKTLVECLATYGSFRRFQVTTSETVK